MTPDQLHRRRNNGAHDRQTESLERWGALLGGGALALYGLTRRSKTGLAIAAAGGYLAYSGSKVNVNAREPIAHTSVLVNCSPQDAYRLWSDFETHPMFNPMLESVTKLDDKRTRWVARGPLGMRLEWTAETASEVEGKSMSWRSLPGSDLSLDGAVRFDEAPEGRGTIISVTMRYRAPNGVVTRALHKMLGEQPSFMLRQDVRRFKALVETGEIPTTEGQSHGSRSRVMGAVRAMNPFQPPRGEGSLGETVEAQRSAS